MHARNINRHLVALLLSTCFVLFVAGLVRQGISQSPKLSEEGMHRAAAHRFLIEEFLPKNESVIQEKKGEDSIVEEVVVLNSTIRAQDELRIELPAGSERIAWMFRYLILKGKNLDRVGGLTLLPYGADSAMHHSKHEKEFYRVQMAALPVPDDTMQPLVITAPIEKGAQVIVDQVLFNSQGKLSTKFNDIPYRNLGEEFPRVSVPVRIATRYELAINGITDLQREKWFRYYAAPGAVHPTFEKWAADRNFAPGRQILKFQPALVEGYSPNQPKLAESASQPGQADLRFFDEYRPVDYTKTIEPFRDIDFAMCMDEWPKFMSLQPNGRGTPKLEYFQAAADLAASYVADQIQDTGRTATWWEVKNESTIKAEWDYHWRKDTDSWKLMADFHNIVADTVRAKNADVKIGGPTSAWMQLQINEFSLFKDQRRFMDLTKDHLDFYSHHFYEDIGSLGAFEQRAGKYTNYLLGRLEAILDMLSAHMHATDNVKPILITECGSLQAGTGPSDNWLRLRSYSAYLNKCMQRPEQLDLVVPFIFLQIPWNPTSGDAAFVPLEGKRPNGPIEDFAATDVSNFFELWRDFDGKRLPVDFLQPWLDAVAVHNGDRIQVALTNMGGRRLDVDLSELAESVVIEDAIQRRLRYSDGQVVYEDAVAIQDMKRIPVDVEETTIVSLRLQSPLQIGQSIQQRAYYAKETAVKIDQTPFQTAIQAPPKCKRARLVVGFQREGFKASIRASFNGHPIQFETQDVADVKNFFAPLTVSIPASWLQETNQLTIEPMPGLFMTSAQLLLWE